MQKWNSETSLTLIFLHLFSVKISPTLTFFPFLFHFKDLFQTCYGMTKRKKHGAIQVKNNTTYHMKKSRKKQSLFNPTPSLCSLQQYVKTPVIVNTRLPPCTLWEPFVCTASSTGSCLDITWRPHSVPQFIKPNIKRHCTKHTPAWQKKVPDSLEIGRIET